MFNKYPYTDNNQLNLDWFLATFKELYDGWVEFKGSMEQAYADLVADVEDFKEFVTDYLDNLDYAQAINDHIDELIASGEFETIIQPVVSSEVSTWLADHIGPTTPAVDTSLTVAGAAADAKVTGEKITESLRTIQLTLTTSNVPGTYPDLKSFPNGSMIAVTQGASALLADSPWNNTAYYLLTGKIGTYASTPMHFQLALPYLGDTDHVAFRSYDLTNSIYTPWQYLSNTDEFMRSLKSINLTLTTTNVPGTYPDLKSFPNGSMITVTQAASSLLTDTPFSGIAFYVMTGKVGTAASTPMHFQLAFPYAGADSTCFAFRTYDIGSSSYNGWRYVGGAMRPFASGASEHVYVASMLAQHDVVTLADGNHHFTSGFSIPAGKTLQGLGQSTKLIFTITSGNAIVLNSGSVLRNLAVVGHDNVPISPTPSTTDSDSGVAWVSTSVEQGIVENCWIENFSNGIICYQTTNSYQHNLLASNCFIKNCNRGIYIKANSEYNRFTNIVITGNGYGILSRGGNNNFVNCGIDGNVIGIQFDEDEGSNSGHSLVGCCTINHTDNNTGYGLLIRDTGRIIVDNCNIYYSKIKIQSSNGNVIGNCGLGTCDIEVTGAGCNIIHDNMCRTGDCNIYLPTNHKCKLHDNYYRDGSDVTPIIV